MENNKIISVLNPVMNWIFPFFKDNKALKLIKKDIQSIGEELLVKAYDSVKGLFYNSESRQSVFEQWSKSLIDGNEPDDIIEGGIKNCIEKALESPTNFKNEMEQFLKEVETKNVDPINKVNSISGTFTNTEIIQDVSNSEITIKKRGA